MGIKCSVFGHDFGETTVERDREEQGNEVVSTIREIETCTRCGETRVVSENTEVTTIKTPDDVAGADEEDDEADAEPAAEIVDAEASEPVDAADASTSGPAGEAEQYESAAEDDGVILEDDTEEEQDREPGEWPESEPPQESPAAEPDGETELGGDGPDQPAGPDLSAAVTSDEGSSPGEAGVSPTEEGAGGSPADDDSGLSPTDDEGLSSADDGAEPSSTDDDAEVWSSTDPDLEGDRPAGGADSGTDDIVDGEFRCTECGFSTPVESSSLREGDYCPECHQGMLDIEAP